MFSSFTLSKEKVYSVAASHLKQAILETKIHITKAVIKRIFSSRFTQKNQVHQTLNFASPEA
jgi:hypothetical protein